MRFRVNILDLIAAVTVLAVLLMPERSSMVHPAYAAGDDELRAIALYQARLAADPGDVDSATRLAELLAEAGQTDWAVQVAGEAAVHNESLSWRALLAVSAAHADRIEVNDAHQFAVQALERCRRLGPEHCPAHEEVRMSLYARQLDAGVRSGINPRIDPRGYQRAVQSAMRWIRVGGGALDDYVDPDASSPDQAPPEAPPERDEGASDSAP